MHRLLGALVICALMGVPACTLIPPRESGWKPPRLHPTPERMQELMAAGPAFVEPEGVTSVTLELYPRMSVVGGFAWALCTVPRHYAPDDNGTIRLADEHQAWQKPIHQMQFRMMVGPFACGENVVRCTVKTFRGVETRQQTLLIDTCMLMPGH